MKYDRRLLVYELVNKLIKELRENIILINDQNVFNQFEIDTRNMDQTSELNFILDVVSRYDKVLKDIKSIIDGEIDTKELLYDTLAGACYCCDNIDIGDLKASLEYINLSPVEKVVDIDHKKAKVLHEVLLKTVEEKSNELNATYNNLRITEVFDPIKYKKNMESKIVGLLATHTELKLDEVENRAKNKAEEMSKVILDKEKEIDEVTERVISLLENYISRVQLWLK